MALRAGGLIALASARLATGAVVYVPSFSKYPGYTGDLEVVGSVTIQETPGNNAGQQQILSWSFSGIDTACVANAGDSVTNGCGIHVHEGTTCASHEEVGGHYYNNALDSDPWLPVVYVASSDGTSQEHVGVPVTTNVSNADILGRVFVVHALDSGKRIACGVIGTETGAGQGLKVERFAAYPGYSGNLKVAGSITIVGASGDATTAKQTLTWSLSGLDTACVANAGDDVTNGCGIHVHAGSTCDSHANVGGHYYSTALEPNDPWLPIVYVASSEGNENQKSVEVVTGLSNGDITGRVMVVHALNSGERIACGVIERQPRENPDDPGKNSVVTNASYQGVGGFLPHFALIVGVLLFRLS